MDSLTEAFRALGDPTRLRILRLIGEARLNVSEVVSLVGVAQSSVSHHLTKLKALDLIREERHGGFTYYSLAIDEKALLWPLIKLAQAATDDHGDRARLTELLRRREDVPTDVALHVGSAVVHLAVVQRTLGLAAFASDLHGRQRHLWQFYRNTIAGLRASC